MGAEGNKELVRRQFELLNLEDVEGAAGLRADDSLNHGRAVNPRAIAKVYASLRTLHEAHVLHEMIAEGDWVAPRTTCTGVHSASPESPVNGGMFVGQPPTGRSYTVQHIHMFRVRDGKLTEHWAKRDDLDAARQIRLKLR